MSSNIRRIEESFLKQMDEQLKYSQEKRTNIRRIEESFLKQMDALLKYSQEKRNANFLISNLLNEEFKCVKERKDINKQNIHQLENLIGDSLSKTNDFEKKRENVIQALKSFDPSQFSWEIYYNFIEKGYTRNLVIENELFEILIICWEKDCLTPIHDHPSDGCWIVGLEGNIFEEKFKKNPDETLTKISQSGLCEGEIGWIHDCVGVHSVGNSSNDKRAATLHLYSPPIKKCSAYQENGSKTIRNLNYFSKSC